MTPALVLLGLLACAAAAPLLAGRLDRNAGYPLAAAFAVGAVAIGTQAPRVVADEPVVASLTWIPLLGVQARLVLDGLSLMFAVLVLGVGVLVFSYCARYLDPGSDPRRLYGLLTLFAASMLGLVLAGDVVLMFVFWELTSVCSFLLIGGDEAKGARQATRAFLVTGGGGLALLAGLALAVVATGTTDLATISTDPAGLRGTTIGTVSSGLVMLAALTKSAQVPFHFWLPDAMVAITPVSAYLHAATMVKAGIYLLARFSPVWADQPAWTVVLVAVGLTSALFGALLALRQFDLKALLAYSTVSQLGWLVTLIGIGTAKAMAAALLHTFAHALFKASLFMLVGIVDREAGSRDVRELSGLWRMMPLTATATGLAALSMAGVPPMLGFVSKEESFIAFLDPTGQPWPAVVTAGLAVLAAALTAAYGLRIVFDAFGGRPQQRLYEPAFAFLAPAAVAAATGLVLGLGVSALNPLLTAVVQDARRVSGEADLALWHGFTPPLALSGLALAGGAVLFLLRNRVDRVLHEIPVSIRGSAVFDRLYDAVLAVGGRVATPARTLGRAGQLVVVLGTGVVVAGVVLAAGGAQGLSPPRPGVVQPADWAVVALLTVAVVGVVTARSALAAVALAGAVGFVLAVWFLLLGAGDVALTQLLVETLTVVVVVLVLRRLPDRFRGLARAPRVGAGAFAGAAGLVAGLGTFLLTGRGERSPVGAEIYRIAEPATGGANVVNTILVDFRGVDTLGETTVLAVVALGVASTLRAPPIEPPAWLGADRGLLLRLLAGPLVPLLLALAVYLLLRGHNEPGGGFIAGLVAGAAVVLRDLATPERRALPRLVPLLAGGAGVAVAVGAAAVVVGGAFLQPAKIEVPLPVGGPLPLTSSLIFDAGVAAVVVGLVVGALRGLGGAPVREGAGPHPPEGARSRDEPARPPRAGGR